MTAMKKLGIAWLVLVALFLVWQMFFKRRPEPRIIIGAHGIYYEDQTRRQDNMTKANYEILEIRDGMVVIKDLGPWDRFMSVTNAAEEVVRELTEHRILLPGKRLFYYDSENHLDEIKVKDGKFAGFAPGPRRHGQGHEL